jgi:PAS domain S-box-containing protein
MRLARAQLREFWDLRMAINTSFLLAIYAAHLLASHWLFGTATHLPPQGLIIFLSFWMLSVLWVAYRRWKAVGITERDLEDILTGISPDIYVVIDPGRRITMCNASIERVLGYAPAEVLGRTTDVLYFDRRPVDQGLPGIHDQLERVGFHVGRATGRRRDGGTLPLEIITATVRHRRGAVLLIRDISKRVEIEEAHREKAELLRIQQEQNHRLRETEEARDNILHMIVHDMKNPLQIILGSMQLLKDELNQQAEATCHGYVDETLVHTRRLSNMVNSILDVSRLEAGQMPLRPAPCDLRVAARRAVGSLQRLAGGRAVRVYAPADPLVAPCDPELIDRVLTNLIGNALHHTPETAEIEVRVQPREQSARIEVADTGPGISPALRGRLFRKFAASGQSFGGHTSTGLGLTFCKLAVEAHGGRIGVECPAAGGSTFWFELPLQAGARLATETATPGPAAGAPAQFERSSQGS